MNAKASPSESTPRQATGLGRIFRGALATRGVSLTSKGRGAPSSASAAPCPSHLQQGGQGRRFRLILLGALAAAFLLLPVASAFGAEEHQYHLTIAGSGEGEVVGGVEGELGGTPQADCHGAAPGEGTCAGELSPGLAGYSIYLEATAAPGSEFTGWTFEEGSPAEAGYCEGAQPECFAGGGEHGNVRLTATFASTAPPAEEHQYHLTIAGSGEGEVVGGVEGELGGTPQADCHGAAPGEGTCAGELSPGLAGYSIYLEATAAPGSEFTGWTFEEGSPAEAGYCEGAQPECFAGGGEHGNVRLTATFASTAPPAEEHQYHLTIAGSGEGEVVGGVEGELGGTPQADCHGAAPGEGTCAGELSPGLAGYSIYLEATAAPGSEFTGWTFEEGSPAEAGYCEGAQPECFAGGGEHGNVRLTATFASTAPPAEEHQYHLTIAGSGEGEVVGGVEGELGGTPQADCHGAAPGEGTCAGELSPGLAGYSIYLEATAAPGSEFTGWTFEEGSPAEAGYCEGAQPECFAGGGEHGNVRLTATFASTAPPAEEHQYHLTIAGSGEGEVVGGVEGELGGTPQADCHGAAPGEGTCAGELSPGLAGYSIYLEATAAPGSEFTGWTFEEGSPAEAGYCEGAQPECFAGGGEHGNVRLTATFASTAPPAEEHQYHLTIAGSGEGEVVGGVEGELGGTPQADCHGAAPGEGTCAGELSPGLAGYSIYLEATAAPGSEFTGWTFEEGSPAEAGYCEGAQPECFAGGGEHGNVRLTATFASTAPPAEEHQYHLTIAGSGEGEVVGGVEGELGGTPQADCHGAAPGEGTCAGELSPGLAGYSIYLEATAAPGSEFTGWTFEEGSPAEAGYCEGAQPECFAGGGEHGNVRLTATFASTAPPAEEHQYHLTIAGSGEGEVVGGVEGELGGTPQADCHGAAPGEGTCAGELSPGLAGYSIYLEATAAPGSEFTGWTFEEGSPAEAGYCEGAQPECFAGGGEHGNVRLTATFASTAPPAEFPLTIEVEGEGSVTGPGINCPEGECSATFEAGEGVSLTATADEHNHFVEWETVEGDAGTCEGASASCEAGPLTQATTLKAKFAPTMRTLTINTAGGEGTGQVNCDVNHGESEDKPCAPEYQDGTELELIAEAGSKSEFEGFENGSGSAESCTGTSPCAFTITASSSVDAPFKTAAGFASLTVHKAGNGKGTIESTPGGTISCGPECPEEGALFAEGPVTLKATPAPPAGSSIFVSWSSNCTPTSATECEVEVGSGGANVTATFIAAAVVTPIAPGGACGEAGGVKVEYAGFSYNICSGEEGAAGSPGETPTITEFSGSLEGHCTEGGTKIETATSKTYVCNGVEGAEGETPTLRQFGGGGEPSGNPCSGRGGVEIAVVGSETFVCNGEKGEKGDAGEPPVVTEFTGAEGPCTEGGVKIQVGAGTPTYVCNGVKGANGTSGSNGTNGTNGSQGPKGDTGSAGSNGSNGAQGPQGPAGKNAKVKVTCKVKNSKKVKCTVKVTYPKSSNNKRHHTRHHLRWSLHRAGHVVSHGKTSAARLQSVLDHLRPGRYVLHVHGQKGGTHIDVS